MSYRVFARKYRPQTFAEVVGQEHITRTLANAVREDRVAQAYMFVGPRGIGKTSTARILAKALNCVQGPTPEPCSKCDACFEIAEGRCLDVIEIDSGVTQVAHELMGLRRDTGIRTFNEDARTFLARQPDREYELVFGDAFNDYSVPYHLTTREFNERVRAWLTDDGLYIVNLIDGPRRDFVRAYVNTLRQSFAHVYVAPSIPSWRDSPRVTFVVLATNRPLDLAALQEVDGGDGDALLARQILAPGTVDEILAEGRAVLLTDRYAPVDQMLAPVVRDEGARPLADGSGGGTASP